LLALLEIVNDKLPKTPSRLIPPQFITRIVTGGFSGAVIGAGAGSTLFGCIAGALGAVAGTLGGAKMRSTLARTFGRDLPAALTEDTIDVAGAAVLLFTLA
jgi:uncharacterized membrane protein